MASDTSLSKIRDAIVEVRNAVRGMAGPTVDLQSQRSALNFLDELERQVVARCDDGSNNPTLELIPTAKE